jgi:ribonuclease E
VLVPNPHIQTPEYSIRRVRDDETLLPENSQISYQIPAAPASIDPIAEREKRPAELPAVAALLPKTAAPITAAPATVTAATAGAHETPSGGFWGRVKRLFGTDQAGVAQTPAAAATAAAPEPRRESSRGGSNTRRDGARGRERRPGRRPPEGARRDQPRRPDTGRGGPDAGRGSERAREEPRREPRRDEPRRDEPPRDEPRRDEPRQLEAQREQEPAQQSFEGAVRPESAEPHAGPSGQGAADRPRSGRSRRGGRRRRRGSGGGNRDAMQGPNSPPHQGEPGHSEGGPPASDPNYSWGAPEANQEHHEAQFNGNQGGGAGHGNYAPAPEAPSHVSGQESSGGERSAPAAAPAPAPAPSEQKPSVVWSSAPAAEPGPTGPAHNE